MYTLKNYTALSTFTSFDIIFSQCKYNCNENIYWLRDIM